MKIRAWLQSELYARTLSQDIALVSGRFRRSGCRSQVAECGILKDLVLKRSRMAFAHRLKMLESFMASCVFVFEPLQGRST